MSSAYMQRYYPESQFGGFTRLDGTIAFFTRVNALLEPSFTVVDFGCGRGQYEDDGNEFRKKLRTLRGKVKRVIGVDIDPAAEINPFVDEFRLLQGARWPLDDASADIVVCYSVMEHVPDPDAFAAECHRVLRPGGTLCLRTPNARSYFGLVSMVVSSKSHAAVLRKVKTGAKKRMSFLRFVCAIPRESWPPRCDGTVSMHASMDGRPSRGTYRSAASRTGLAQSTPNTRRSPCSWFSCVLRGGVAESIGGGPLK